LPHKSVIAGNKIWRAKLLARHYLRRPADARIFPDSTDAPRVFHGLDHITPYLNASTVVTVLDVSFRLFPEAHSRPNRLFLERAVPVCVRRAKRVIVISENTGRDLVKWVGADIADKIRVTPLGGFNENAPIVSNELLKFGLQPQNYVLCVGTIEPRKNQARLVEAYAGMMQNWNGENPPALVLVGKVGWAGEYERIVATAGRAGLSVTENGDAAPGKPQILLLTGVNDTDLRTLYAHAGVVCYPTLYEGFGLPALEAMAAGVPLVTSNTSSLPEITGADGENALTVDPQDTAAIGSALRRLLTDAELAARLRVAGRARARLFTWERTAELTRRVYEEVFSR
jgi:glycosyltransferase involved in cell wall biosynthesis